MTDSGSEKKHIIIVSVDSSTSLTLKLSITELDIDPEDNKQLIEWVLDEELSRGGGEFVDLSDCKPGFEWLSLPPPDAAIFDKAVRPKKESIEIRDTHKKGTGSDGTWIYKLRVRYQHDIYETPVSVAISDLGETRMYVLIGNNPIIINR